MTGRRSVNIYDYPEHLNPFFEDDNHTKLRFWTNTKRKSRSNSFSFQSIKDFKQSLFSRPARKRSGTSSSLSQLSCYRTHEINDETPKNDETPQNDEFSRSDEKRKSFIYPTLRKLGRSFSIRSKNKKRETSVDRTSQSPSENEATYSYSRSTISNRQTMPAETVTPLPRIRFHERIRNVEAEKCDENKATSPTDDTNPFKDEVDEKIPSTPSTSKPTTPPRKKKRAPPPPPLRQSSLTRKSLSAEFSLHSEELKDNTTNEINHKDVEQTQENITRTEIEITKIENEIPKIENDITKTENDIPRTEIPKIEVTKTEDASTENDNAKTENEINDEKISTDNSPEEEEKEPFEINYNSELNISSSEISVSSETKLEQQQQQSAIEDSSDLLELVQKLQLEVEKLTDDTNNNVITPNFDSGKKPNFYGQDDDDDSDVVIGAPLSPRFIRLRKDNEWIKH